MSPEYPSSLIFRISNSGIRLVAAVMMLAVAACAVQTATGEGDAIKPLTEIEAGLKAHPPALGVLKEREALVAGLESWIARDDAVYWDLNPDTANAELFGYYLRSIQEALDEAENTVVESGAIVWKLYSSGFLVKTPDGIIAIDAVEGPFKSLSRSPEEEEGFLFHWTPEMRRQFGAMVDYLFITHRHYDHASWALAKAVGAAGNTVVVTHEFKERIWFTSPFSESLRTIEPELDTELGKFTVQTFQAVQAMQKDENGDYAVRVTDPEHNVYLIRDSRGFTFLHNGDNRGREFTPWLKEVVADGWTPDVWLKITAWPSKLVNQVMEITQPVIVPGHEWEFGHKPKYGTNKLLPFYKSQGLKYASKGKMLILTWGESYHFGQ